MNACEEEEEQQNDGGESIILIYLHGFGCMNPIRECAVGAKLQTIVADMNKTKRQRQKLELFSPCYHPGGNIPQTNLKKTIEDLHQFILLKQQEATAAADNNKPKQVLIVGYSVGGYLAALFASQYPELLVDGGVLLLAPAIDNYQRNFENVKPSKWYMPASYVLTLRDELPARPPIDTQKVKTVIVHGLRDNDNGGSAPWRVQQYAKSLSSTSAGAVRFYEPNMDHSLHPWLSATNSTGSSSCGTPTLEALVESFLLP